MALHPKTIEEYNKLKARGGKIIVDYSGKFCNPCRRIAPVFEKLAEETLSILFVKADVEELQGAEDLHDVSSIPCFKYFEDGLLVESFVGGNSEKLQALVAQHA